MYNLFKMDHVLGTFFLKKKSKQVKNNEEDEEEGGAGRTEGGERIKRSH